MWNRLRKLGTKIVFLYRTLPFGNFQEERVRFFVVVDTPPEFVVWQMFS